MVTISWAKSEYIGLFHAINDLHWILACNFECKIGLPDMLNEEDLKPHSHIIVSRVLSSTPLQSDNLSHRTTMPEAVDVTEFTPIICRLHWS